MSHESVVPPECGRALGFAVVSLMEMLVTETMHVDEHDVELIKLARVGPRLVIVGESHRYTCYHVDATTERGEFRLDPARVVFVLHQTGFDWDVECIRDPRAWYNSVMVEIHMALKPVAPLPN